MAKLPDVTALGERPSPAAVTGVARYRTEQGSEDVGNAITVAGGDVDHAATQLYRAQKVEQDRVDTLRAEEAFSKLREKQLDLSIGPENGFTNVKGSEAVSRPMLPEWNKKFDDEQKLLADSLGNDAQRYKFAHRATLSRMQFGDDILHHMANQREVYGKEVYEGVLGTEERSAAAKWDSPADIGLSLTRVDDAVHSRAEAQGWPAEYANSVLLESKGKIHKAVIDQAIANQNFDYAEKWFEQNKDNIDSHTAATLSKAVEGGAQKQRAADYVGDYISHQQDYLGLGKLQDTVLADPVLDDTRKNTIMGRIQNQRFALERRAEVETARRQHVIGKAINENVGNILAGYEPSLEQIQPIINAAKGTDLEEDANRMVQLAQATRTFRNQAPAQQEAMITGAETQLRSDPTKFDRRVLDAWKEIKQKQGEQVKDDPVTFATRQGYAPPVPLNLAEPGAVAGDLAQRYSLARAVSDKYQAPFKPLTKPELGLVTEALSKGTWQQKGDYLAKLHAASAGDEEGYSAVLQQVAPDEPVTAVAGEYAAKDRKPVADLMLRGESILRPAKKTDGTPDRGTLLPMPAEKEMRSAFDDKVRDAYAGRVQQRNVMYQSARSIYAALSADAGDKDTAVLDSDRWDKAITMATGGVDKYRGKHVVLPYGMDLGTFKDQMDARLGEVAASGALPPTLTASRLADLPVESIGDGKYILRSGDSVLVGAQADGHKTPIVIDFNKPISSNAPKLSAVPPLPDYPVLPQPTNVNEALGQLEIVNKRYRTALQNPETSEGDLTKLRTVVEAADAKVRELNK